MKIFPSYPQAFYMFVYSRPCERILSAPSVYPTDMLVSSGHRCVLTMHNAVVTHRETQNHHCLLSFSDIFAVLPRTVALVFNVCCFGFMLVFLTWIQFGVHSSFCVKIYTNVKNYFLKSHAKISF